MISSHGLFWVSGARNTSANPEAGTDTESVISSGSCPGEFSGKHEGNTVNNLKKIDLHIHSTVSDGTDTPEEILALVKKACIRLFALTDHDAIKGCLVLRKILKEDDPQFVTGAEFSCRDDEGQYHILGYGYDPNAKSINGLVEKGHSIRMNKVRARLELLKSKFGFSFPEEEIQNLMAQDNPGKPHIANLMAKYGYARSRDEAMKEYLNKLRVQFGYISPEEAIAAILKGGGIPVLAHPSYGNGDQLILGEEMERRLRRLKDFGLRGMEAFYSGFPERMVRDMLDYAEKYDLLVTAGSDFHGSNKLVKLGDTGLDLGTEFPERLRLFLEEISVI